MWRLVSLKLVGILQFYLNQGAMFQYIKYMISFVCLLKVTLSVAALILVNIWQDVGGGGCEIGSIGVSDFLSNVVDGLDNGVGVNMSGCVKELRDILDLIHISICYTYHIYTYHIYTYLYVIIYISIC